jgi:CHAT domain-containing protein
MRTVEDYWKEHAEGRPVFDRLSTTGQLAERLQHTYGHSAHVLTGLAASEPEIRQRSLKAYVALVFATHGILDGEVPYIQEPALVLSQVGVTAQDREQDGFLTLSEVMELELAADVVVLTACNTGVGKQLTGEGVLGLGWAFQYAGARHVLMSLWSVEEASTVLLAERFLTYLHQRLPPLEALRQARADVRRAGYDHPYFWAPFILVGAR